MFVEWTTKWIGVGQEAAFWWESICIRIPTSKRQEMSALPNSPWGCNINKERKWRMRGWILLLASFLLALPLLHDLVEDESCERSSMQYFSYLVNLRKWNLIFQELSSRELTFVSLRCVLVVSTEILPWFQMLCSKTHRLLLNAKIVNNTAHYRNIYIQLFHLW